MKKNYLKHFITVFALVFTHLAYAQSTFSFTGDTQMYVVPADVTVIEIEAAGAQGGEGSGGDGGLGATMKGSFNVNPNDTLIVIVGGEGIFTSNSGSGGAGTGVTHMGLPLIVAGGGGGASSNAPGFGGVITEDADSSSGAGGSNGMGGHKGYWSGDCGWGAGGGGFYGDGYGGDGNWDGSDTGVLGINGGGQAWANGGAGGIGSGCNFVSPYGPWGCGGGGSGEFGGGGGGGYSGGAGGHYVDVIGKQSGTGGGSYNTGFNQNNIDSNHTGNGQVVISVLCQRTYASETINECDSFTTNSGTVYNTAGTYTFNDTLINNCGSDSIITYTLNLTTISISISDVNNTLKASLGLDSYQWYNENGILTGEIANEFTPAVSGDYYCEGTKDACSKNSNTIEFTVNTSIQHSEISKLQVYPNPTSDIVNIETDETLTSIRLIDLSGKTVKTFKANSKQLNISEITTGIYFLEVANSEKKSVVKIIKR